MFIKLILCLTFLLTSLFSYAQPVAVDSSSFKEKKLITLCKDSCLVLNQKAFDELKELIRVNTLNAYINGVASCKANKTISFKDN